MPKNKKESNPSEKPGTSEKALKSPFKFLAPYSAEDKDAFWGRDAEIKELYEMLFATNLVLLYGPSGTGKTSLIQCGLSKKFSGPDWIPLMIRRGEDFISSLKKDLQSISGLPETSSIPDHIIHTYNTYYRPVYLFFDQFEEIFTLAHRDKNGKVILDTDGELKEVKELFTTLQQLATTLPCKVVFSFREEFLGQLYSYEKYLPTLFDFRLRVEPMNTARINEVLEGSFRYFNISCDPPEVGRSIADNLLEGKATSQLAYLQVYMDKLWKTALVEDPGQEWQATTPPPPVTITTKTLDRVGDVRKVLEVYLQDQEEAMANSLGIQQTWVRDLLDSFVTDDGTKRPIAEESPKLNPKNKLSKEQLGHCLTQLQEARLIRKDNQYYELAHDTLAGILANKRTASQRLVKEITQSIRTSYNLPIEGDGSYLNEEYVELYDKYQAEINDELEGNDDKGGIIQYIEESRKNNEERTRNLEDKNQRLGRYLIGILVLLICAGILVIYALLAREESVVATNIAKVHYWTSEAENIIPVHLLRLMEVGDRLTNDQKATNALKKKTLKTFNASPTHRFKEKIRFENFLSGKPTLTRLVTYSTDANEVAEFQVWNIENGTLSNSFKVEKNLRVEEVSADGKWMLTANPNKDKYIVWDTESKKKYAFLQSAKNISVARFSNDGRWLFTTDSEGRSRVWDLGKKRELTYLTTETGVWREEFSSDSKWLLTSDENYTYKVWETATGKVPDFFRSEQGIMSAEFSANGKWLLTTHEKGRIKVWDLTKRKQPDFLKLDRPLREAVFSDNGQLLFTRNDKDECRIWETADGQVHDFLKNERGLSLPIFSSNGDWLFIKNGAYESFVWETCKGIKHNVFNGGSDIWYARISDNGKWVFTKNSLGNAKIWSIGGGQVPNFLKNEQINDATFSADDKYMFTISQVGLFQKWEMDKERKEIFPLGENNIDTLVFSPDSQWYYVRNGEGIYQVFDTETDKALKFANGDEKCWYVEFSPNGQWILVVDLWGKYRLFSTETGQAKDFLNGRKNSIKAEFSADGKWLVTVDKESNYEVQGIGPEGLLEYHKAENDSAGVELFANKQWKVRTDHANKYHLAVVPGKKNTPVKGFESPINFTIEGKKYSLKASGHKINTMDSATMVQTVYLNTVPNQVHLIKDSCLYVRAGKALLKTNLKKQRGNFFTYGDGQTLDYSYDEIMEWMEVFGSEYLGDLDEYTKEKYDIKEKDPSYLVKIEAFFSKLFR